MRIPVIQNKTDEILKKKDFSYYQLSKLIDFDESALNKMLKGKISLSPNLLEKIAPILEVSPDEIKSWIIADKYPENIIQIAVKIKRETPKEKNKKSELILTAKIDEILEKKRITRTGLSKIINYRQGKLNEMIIGKKPVSKSVTEKISKALELTEEEIRAWILADKYDLSLLESAYQASALSINCTAINEQMHKNTPKKNGIL